MLYISSPVNPTIKYYNSLSRAKIRARDRVFMVEGDVLLQEALSAGMDVVSALVDQSRTQSIADLIQTLESRNVPVYSAPTAAIERASTMDTPQSILAVCRVPDTRISMNEHGKYIVCENLQNPGNAGAILRSAAAFGIDGVFFVGGCDIYSVKVLRGSMGAAFRVPVQSFPSAAELSEYLKQNRIPSYAAVVGKDAQSISEHPLPNACAVWIGNEGNGLSDQAVSCCEHRIYIPMKQNTESLNASVAASIIMWEMSK